jgi:hypothetical protein
MYVSSKSKLWTTLNDTEYFEEFRIKEKKINIQTVYYLVIQ